MISQGLLRFVLEEGDRLDSTRVLVGLDELLLMRLRIEGVLEVLQPRTSGVGWGYMFVTVFLVTIYQGRIHQVVHSWRERSEACCTILPIQLSARC